MNITENVDIREHSTLKVGGQFRYLIEIKKPEEIQEAHQFAKEKNLPLFILGGGSNIVFPDGVFLRVVLKIEIDGFEVINDTELYADIKIGAGENWDSVVGRAVEMNLAGIEAMSAIPGTAGGTPVQNVGAYGQEIKNTLLEVEVFDTRDQTMKVLTNPECYFSYRGSIFKNEAKGRYIIISLTLRLSKEEAVLPEYPGVKKYFLENNINEISLSAIRQAISAIRSVKLPDPKKIANVGSFFKNPIVPKEIALELNGKYETLHIFPVDESHTKVPAGWLIENAGLKGKTFGPISTYQNNALVLVNNGTATRADVEQVKNEIIEIVSNKFGIKLEAEPEFV